MSRLSPFFALFLLALWLPATLHCQLQAAGFFTAPDCCLDEQACSNDSCDVVSSNLYKPAQAALQAPAPSESRDLFTAFGSFDLLGLRLAGPSAVAPPSSSFERPLNWITTWHFARRTAPLSRAPASVLT